MVYALFRSPLLPSMTLCLAILVWFTPVAKAAIEAQEVTSPTGIRAYLVEDPSLPVVSITAHFDAGAAYDPVGKGGLAYMVSGLLDEGAGTLDSRAFQDRLADLAIELSFDTGRDSFTMELRTTKQYLSEAMDLARLSLTEPRFDAEPVARIRSQIIAMLRSDAADPSDRAAREWYTAVFGDHPYGRNPDGTLGEIETIMPSDLREFTRTQLHRHNLSIGVAGDINAEQLGAVLDHIFGALPAGPSADMPRLAAPAPVFDGSVLIVDQDTPQSQAIFGQAGLVRDDPDWIAAHTLNYILGGGGFVSRLMIEVREKRGLAYSVYSYLYPLERTGLWIGGVATQNARMGESLDVIRAEWQRLAQEGPTASELADAKTYLTGAWPLRFTSSRRIAGMLASMHRNSLPVTYLDQRNEEIEALTLEDLQRVARRLLDPNQLTWVIVGKPAGV